MRLTNHGEKRVRKRLGFSKKAVMKQAEQAKLNGIPRQQFSGSVRRYLDKYALDYVDKGTDLYVYNHNLFVFRNNLLITAWPLPSKYRKLVNLKRKGG